ncbi:hypothetical protein DFS34DRAFT_642024 [Phlyctochytrium arcticum]|nr:hypothetical protein DFS34DRAFT_642024 [Phlyctochytrium arcticum]
MRSLSDGGEGGTGKSRVIKAFPLQFSRLGQDLSMIFTASSGSVAAEIDGNTYHSTFCVSDYTKNKQQTSQEDPACYQWSRSMMGCKHLVQIESKLRDSRRNVVGCQNKVFGGMQVLFLAGDFMQFSPVKEVSIGVSPATNPRAAGSFTVRGRLLFHQYIKVVMLDKQVRAKNDPLYLDFLTRLRCGEQTKDNAECLNILSIDPSTLRVTDNLRILTPLNWHRWQLSLAMVSQWAADGNKLLTIFVLRNSWNDYLPSSMDALSAMLVGDDSNSPVPAIFPYSKGMPVCLIKNTYVGLKATNGALFEAVDNILDPHAALHNYGHGLRVHIGPPLGIILWSESTQRLNIPNLPSGTILIPPNTTPVSYFTSTRSPGKCSRKGLACTPGFAVPDYKSQGKTLSNVMVGLYGKQESSGTASACPFVSMYVQLSRATSFTNLCLLRLVNVRDFVQAKPPPEMIATVSRLDALSRLTLAVCGGLLSVRQT